VKEQSRTGYSILNASVSSVIRILTIILGYVSRMVFVRMLDQYYVGINGLFLEYFKLLSLSELGISTAITYALYKPIAEGDTEKQKSVMDLYRRFYNIVAMVVLISGLLLFPFLDVLIKDNPSVEHLQLIYLLYLANTVVSYLFVYKKTLIDAHQRMYVSMWYYGVFLTLQYVLQMIILVCTKNFILYLVVFLICTLLHNILISQKASRLYPYIKEKAIMPLSAEDKHGIANNIKAMFMHKIGSVVVANTDSLLISSMVGIVSTACYTNYRLVIGSVQQVLNQLFQGVSASIGNLGAEEDEKKLTDVFGSMFLVGFWVYGFSAVCLFELLDPFVALSFGEQYIFSVDITFILSLNFYLTGIRQPVLSFRDSLGLFWYDRYKSIAEAALNLIVSVLLAVFWGTAGVFWGTLISTVLVPLWVEPYVLYKHRFKQPLRSYFVKLCLYTLVLLLSGIMTYSICSHIHGDYVRQLFLRMPVCLIIPNVMIWLCVHRTEEYKSLMGRIRQFIKRKKSFNHSGDN